MILLKQTPIFFALAAAAFWAVLLLSSGGHSFGLDGASEPDDTRLPETARYIEVMGGCDAAYEGSCVTAHAGAGSAFPVVWQLRTGMVLTVASTTVADSEGHLWHEVMFTEWVRYPDRLPERLFVRAESVKEFIAPEVEWYEEGVTAPTTKHIIIDRGEQKAYAYDGNEIVFWYPISISLSQPPAEPGHFMMYKKTPSRYLQGPLPGNSPEYVELPGVPWVMYFSKDGGTIHGTYWLVEGEGAWPQGSVSVLQDGARVLYNWAPVGTPVTVRD